MAEVEIRPVESRAEHEALYAFRYKVYVEELAMTDHADHARKWLRDGYDTESVNYAMFSDGDIVGSLRCIRMDRVSDPQPLIDKFEMQPAIDAFGAGAIITTSRFMVAHELRSGMAILRMLHVAYNDTRRAGVRLNYGDCSPHLLPFYEQLGYQRYTDGFDDTAFGYKLPILMLVHNRERFARTRSPLARLVKPEEDDTEAREWFARTYPDYVDLISASFMSEETYFDLLAERVADNPLHSVSLLQGLNRDEAQKFLSKSTVIEVKAGDRIIRQGDRDNTLFVLLSGLAEVRLNDGAGPPLAVFAAGDSFGEIGYLTPVARTANVIARTDCEVLVLSGDFVNRFIAAEPSIGARVLNNLARELAARLAMATHSRTVEP